MGGIVKRPDLIRQSLWNGGGKILASGGQRLGIIPAFEVNHGQRFFQPGQFLLHLGPPPLKQLQPLLIGRSPHSAPDHKLPDVLDLHAGLLQTFNDPERFNLRLTKLADAGYPFHVRKKSLFIIIAQRRDGQSEHLCHLSN